MELYSSLAADSNEAVLIQRAAFYMTTGGKQSEFYQASPAQKAKSVAQVLNSPSYINNFKMFNKMLPVHRLNMNAMMGVYKLGYFVSTQILHIGQDKVLNDTTLKPLIDLLSTNNINPNLINIIKLSAANFAIKAYAQDPSENVALTFSEPFECRDLPDNAPTKWKLCSDALAKLVEKNPVNQSLQSNITDILESKAGGIEYHIDKNMGTNMYVFSILGINRGSQYGHIYVPIKPEIFPMAWSTPVAATFFYKNPANLLGKAQYGAEVGRVWVIPEQLWLPEGQAAFEASKVRGPREVLALVAATEMMGRVLAYYLDNGELKLADKQSLQEPMSKLSAVNNYEQISPAHVRTYMENIDSHNLWEVHVAPFPISYIQNVIMSKAIYDSGFDKLMLSPEQQAKLIIKALPNPEMQAVSEDISAPY